MSFFNVILITKFNFNSLFSKAWLQSVTPANIIAGFKSCGVYPFNSAAIKIPSVQSGNSNAAKESEPFCSNGEVSPAAEISSTRTDVSMVATSSFIAEQLQLYKKRFNEGYNLFIDPDYVRWLGMYHPEFCPPIESESVASLFSDICREEPVAVFDHANNFELAISIPVETPTRDTVSIVSMLSCVNSVPVSTDEVIVPTATPITVVMMPGTSRDPLPAHREYDTSSRDPTCVPASLTGNIIQ